MLKVYFVHTRTCRGQKRTSDPLGTDFKRYWAWEDDLVSKGNCHAM